MTGELLKLLSFIEFDWRLYHAELSCNSFSWAICFYVCLLLCWFHCSQFLQNRGFWVTIFIYRIIRTIVILWKYNNVIIFTRVCITGVRIWRVDKLTSVMLSSWVSFTSKILDNLFGVFSALYPVCLDLQTLAKRFLFSHALQSWLLVGLLLRCSAKYFIRNFYKCLTFVQM